MSEQSHIPHSMMMEERNRLILSGVNDVESFDDENINLQTVKGALCIKGNKMKIEKFNAESCEISIIAADIYAVVYLNDKKEKGGFFGKLFK